MNLNCEICLIAHRAIIERVALLYSGILPFSAQASVGVKMAYYIAYRHGNIILHTNYCGGR